MAVGGATGAEAGVGAGGAAAADFSFGALRVVSSAVVGGGALGEGGADAAGAGGVEAAGASDVEAAGGGAAADTTGGAVLNAGTAVAGAPALIEEGSGRGSMVTLGRRCQATTPTTRATSAATPNATLRRERTASDDEASQSVLVFFSLRAAGAGVITLTRNSSVGWSPVTGVPGLCSVRSDDGDLSAGAGRKEVARKIPEMRATDGKERGANGAKASASSETVW